MVVAAEERAVEIGASTLEAFDLVAECSEAAPSDGLPLGDRSGVEHAVDLVEVEAGVLEHADEHEPADRVVAVAALTGDALVRAHEPTAFVVADRGGGQADTRPDLTDGQQTICHEPT